MKKHFKKHKQLTKYNGRFYCPEYATTISGDENTYGLEMHVEVSSNQPFDTSGNVWSTPRSKYAQLLTGNPNILVENLERYTLGRKKFEIWHLGS